MREGRAYVTGFTSSADYPTTPGTFDTSFNSGIDAFVTKLNASGSALAYSTFVGGRSDEFGEGIAVDAEGRAYVTGETSSADYPTNPGAFDTTFNGGFSDQICRQSSLSCDSFVTKLKGSGSALVYSTFLGGTDSEGGSGIAVRGGMAYVTGTTQSADFPTTSGAFDGTFGANLDAFVTKLPTVEPRPAIGARARKEVGPLEGPASSRQGTPDNEVGYSV